VRNFCAGILLIALLCSHAAAQSSQAKIIEVRGQIFLPNGNPAQGKIRFLLGGEEGQRPQESYSTDSKGGFVIKGLKEGDEYIFVVESDGKSWATTTERVHLLGAQPYVTLRLRPLVNTPLPEKAGISPAELNQKVPPAAMRAYEFAVEQLAAGDLARARKQFERAIELFPDFVDARSELAVVHMRQDALASAEALLRRALEIDPTAVRALLNLGLCLYRQQRSAEALPVLERGIQLKPENPSAHLLYGITLVAAGDDARAEPALRKAYEQGGVQVAKAQLVLSQLYVRQQKFGLAADALEIYLRDLPDVPDAESLRATLARLRAAANP
jgi:Flp pilus assembly protein TadD